MGALTGIRVADFTRVLAGPYATMLLGDLGADVVKIEAPLGGDVTRTWGPPFDSNGRSTYFQSVNRNKGSLVLDLNSKEDQATALELIETCDVLIENFAFGTMKKFGLDYESLSIKYPHLIYCSISGFGVSETARNLPGYDLLVQAVSGLMSITGTDSDNPTKVGVALVDVVAGMNAALGILAALHHRSAGGLGQRVEINLLSSALSAMVNQSGGYVGAGVIPIALGNAHPSIAPYESYRARDGRFILSIGNEGQFRKFCDVLGMKLYEDARFFDNTSRVENRMELNAILGATLFTRPVAHWLAECAKVGVPAGPINDMAQAINLAESLGLAPVVTIIDPLDGTSSKTIANPIKLSETPVEYRLGPPSINGK